MKYLIALLSCLFLLKAAYSQSLAPNGDFDLGINGWHCGSANPTWISDDGSGMSGNGSLQMSRENFISNGGQLSVGHCDWIGVSPEHIYLFDGFYKLPLNSEFENMVIYFYWYTEDETFVSYEEHVIPTDTTTRDAWISFAYSSTAPVDATKLFISLSFQFYVGGQQEVSAFFRWDDLYLMDISDEIFSAGFE